MEWKVLELNDDGSAFVISAKILAKMEYNRLASWLNEDFLNNAFTKKQKSCIKKQSDYQFYQGDDLRIYLPTLQQLSELEGTYPTGTVKETEFAGSLCRTKKVYCAEKRPVDETGKLCRGYFHNGIYGVRPAMDVYHK